MMTVFQNTRFWNEMRFLIHNIPHVLTVYPYINPIQFENIKIISQIKNESKKSTKSSIHWTICHFFKTFKLRYLNSVYSSFNLKRK